MAWVPSDDEMVAIVERMRLALVVDGDAEAFRRAVEDYKAHIVAQVFQALDPLIEAGLSDLKRTDATSVDGDSCDDATIPQTQQEATELADIILDSVQRAKEAHGG